MFFHRPLYSFRHHPGLWGVAHPEQPWFHSFRHVYIYSEYCPSDQFWVKLSELNPQVPRQAVLALIKCAYEHNLPRDLQLLLAKQVWSWRYQYPKWN